MNEAVFKTTVMGGFNKSDVLAFIDKQDKQFREREKDLVTRVDGLSAGLKNETLHSEQLTQRVAELESQLEAEKKKNSETVRKLQEASITVAQIKSGMTGEVERRDAEIDKMRLESCELTRKINEVEAAASAATARSEALEGKLNLIDKTEDQIGRAMLESQQMADKIIGSAKEEAVAITDKARDEASNLIAQANEHVQTLNTGAQEKLDLLLREVADYEKRVTESRADTAEFFRAVDSVFTSMQNNASDILTRFTNAFKVVDDPVVSYEVPVMPDEDELSQSDITHDGFSSDDVSQQDTTHSEDSPVKFDFSGSDSSIY